MQLWSYNQAREVWHDDIKQNGLQHARLWIWYSGTSHKGNILEEFSESCSFPIQDLSTSSECTGKEANFNHISHKLGIPWKNLKDQLFAPTTIYIGFVWDLEACTVRLSPAKVKKYAGMINDWLVRPNHTLKNVQELYRKLLHSTSILIQGQAYLVGLEGMLLTCTNQLTSNGGMKKSFPGLSSTPSSLPPFFLILKPFQCQFWYWNWHCH